MRSLLDDFFSTKMSEGAYVILADSGNFMMTREHKNCIDVGNNEAAAGSIAVGLLQNGYDVYIYDICGYIMRAAYPALAARWHGSDSKKSRLTIIGWGSGFAYDGCLEGHYPHDDINLARLLGLEVLEPCVHKAAIACLNADDTEKYVRICDLDKWTPRGDYFKSFSKASIVLIAKGWLLKLTEDILNEMRLEGISVDKFVVATSQKVFTNKIYEISDQSIASSIENNFLISPNTAAMRDWKHYESLDAFKNHKIYKKVCTLLKYADEKDSEGKLVVAHEILQEYEKRLESKRKKGYIKLSIVAAPFILWYFSFVLWWDLGWQIVWLVIFLIILRITYLRILDIFSTFCILENSLINFNLRE